MQTQVRKALQQHQDFLTESTNRLRQQVIYIWMLFVFLQTPCPNSHCSIQLGGGGLKPAVGCSSGCPQSRGANFDPFVTPFIFLLASLKKRAVSGESAISSPQSRRTSGRLVLIAGLLSHILEALTRCLGQVAGLHAAAGRLPRPELAIGTLSPGRNACDVICPRSPVLRLCSRMILGVRLPVGNISGE